MPAPLVHRAQLSQSAELLEEILAGQGPADRLMERYFRAHRNMGARDRGFVAETVYGVLHRRRQLDAVLSAAEAAGAAPLPAPGLGYVLAHALTFGGWSAEALAERGFGDPAAALAPHVAAAHDPALPFAVRANLPDWLAERLLAEFGESEAEALAQALHRPAPLDLRVNPLRATREQAAEALQAAGFAVEPTPYAPDGLRCHGRKPLQSTQPFREGWIEVQDEGSQLVSLLLEPRPGRGQRFADFCAGAGGKSLHLATLMRNLGSVDAFDISRRRLEGLRQRLRRAQLDNIRVRPIGSEDDPFLARYAGKMAGLLVDAPCSGTGTIRRNPDILWRALDLAALTATQRRILAAAARLVKPGGRLVYATCSLVREENEGVVEAFLAEHADFRPVPVGGILQRLGIAIEGAETETGGLRLLPHRHRTDGFRVAVMERNA